MINVDLSGKVFGRLTIINYAYSKNGRKYWHCKCKCGNEKDIIGKDLKNGNIKSCGCLRKETSTNMLKTHGSSNTRLYHIWCSMKNRCLNPTSQKSKKDYKERGITLCEDWKIFEKFQIWALENGYSDELTIDRIDNDGNYCPENCRWADLKTQANNKRNNRWITYNGETKTIAQWANKLGIKYNTLDERFRKGWPIEKALTNKLYCKEVI